MSGLTGNNILAGSSGQGGYEIEQSLRFEDGDSAYLSRTLSSPTDGKVFTLSFWLKRGNIGTSLANWFFGGSGGNAFIAGFNASSDALQVVEANTGYGQTTEMVFRDVGNWYHITIIGDSTQASNDDRIKIYVNGSQVTTTKQNTITQNSIWGINTASASAMVGRHTGTSGIGYCDGYLAEVNFIDGQALDASNFGETDLLTNQWIPKKYVGTYGTNGFYLNFSNSASLGADSSGNGNNFTPTNLAATDQVLDSPTNNFATLDILGLKARNGSNLTLSEGNLKCTSVATTGDVQSSIGMRSGKWYAEAIVIDSVYPASFGVMVNNGTADQTESGTHSVRVNNTIIQIDLAEPGAQTGLSGISVGDIIGIAFDADTRSVQFYKNNSTYGTAETCPLGDTGNFYYFYFGNGTTVNKQICFNFGQDSSFAGNKTAQNNTDGNGKGDFFYPPPAGYLALCEDNLPMPEIALPGDHFNTVLYTGNGSTQSITGVGSQPDFTWIKSRSYAEENMLFDVLRGATKNVRSNSTAAEVTSATSLTSFDSDGFSLGSFANTNQNTSTYASWNWKANGSGSSNTNGTITSTVSANTTAGFSIATYTGNGSTSPTTVGHGLNTAPNLVIVKRRDAVSDWIIGHDGLATNAFANNKFLKFDTSAVFTNAVVWGSQPTSSVVQITNGSAANLNASGGTYVMYCFHELEGYSKFGSYTGNGNADGTFIYTGFRPAFVLFKLVTLAGDSWTTIDNKRDPYNKAYKALFPDLTAAENTVVNNDCDLVSNGIKIRNQYSRLNAVSQTYIYMAFAESPFKTSNAR